MLSKEQREAMRGTLSDFPADWGFAGQLVKASIGELLDTCDELEQILRDIQWRGDIGHRLSDIGLCPACGAGQNIYDHHGHDCPIGKVLTVKTEMEAQSELRRLPAKHSEV